MAAGATVRVQLLARDIIVSTQMPQHLSVRNNLRGVGHRSHRRRRAHRSDRHRHRRHQMSWRAITKAATRELALAPGMAAWALVKSVSLRGHSSFANPRT